MRAGDTVRFTVDDRPPADHPTPRASTGVPDPPPSRAPLVNRGNRFVEVVDPGTLSLVQDAGRRGVGSLGVPRAGPADPESMRLANRLVGNSDGAAVVEVTLRGPSLRFGDDAHVAVVASVPEGADVSLDGHPVGSGLVVPVRGGQTLRIGEIHGGLRAYLAIGGGLETPPVVGSRSTDVLSGIGPGPLVTGDRLDLGPASRPHGTLHRSVGATSSPDGYRVRILAGPHRFPATSWACLLAHPWMVGSESNRIGIRLRSAEGPLSSDRPTVTSTAMITGAVQVPPDGNPIVLMPDHATVGGYPVIGCVIAADLPVLGQLRPGDRIELVAVDRGQAERAWATAERLAAITSVGLVPHRGRDLTVYLPT